MRTICAKQVKHALQEERSDGFTTVDSRADENSLLVEKGWSLGTRLVQMFIINLVTGEAFCFLTFNVICPFLLTIKRLIL